MKLDSLVSEGKHIIYRDKIILNQERRAALDNRVNLHYWSPSSDSSKENLGDYLSLVVCEQMAQIRNHSLSDTVPKKKHLYAIGSILGLGYQNATVWGSGFLSSSTTRRMWAAFRKLDIRAVRGPKTRDELLKNGYLCPKVYGDPAILMPDIYMPKRDINKKCLIIPHYTRVDKMGGVNMLTKDYKEVIDQIVSSELVISESLHGIILAEAYGVPAVVLNIDNRLCLFKYEDYYQGTGRKTIPMVYSIESAMKMKLPKVPDLSECRERLKLAFPIDLWD